MRTIILLCSVISLSQAWNIEGSCKIDLGKDDVHEPSEDSEEYYNYDYEDEYTSNEAILDTDLNKVFRKFSGVNMREVSVKSTYYSDNGKYFIATLSGNDISLSTSDAFANFEYERSDDSTSNLEFKVLFKCDEGSEEMTFYQPINDTNNHEPFFNRKTYTYQFGMELRKGFELTKLMEIYATDIDYTNRKLIFSIDDNDYLAIQYKTQQNNYKTHNAALITKKDIKGPIDVEIKITATDTAKAPKEGHAIVHLVIV